MKLTVKDSQGASQGEVEVAFGLIENAKGTQAVHDTVVAYRAAQRSGTACTKTMGEVAGTGKKPWRQKGTGRARAGSFQSPIWRGGGVVFGPKPRDFSKKIARGVKQLALRKALSARMQAGEVTVLEDLKLASPKTKEFVKVCDALAIDGSALFVVAGLENNVLLASRNVPCVELVAAADLNTYQTLRCDRLFVTKAALAQLEARLSEKA